MKTCNFCRIEKSKADFYKKAGARDGLSWWCRACHKEKMRAAYHALAADPMYREVERQRVRSFWQANPTKRAEADKKYARNNRAQITAKLVKRRTEKIRRTPAWLSEDDLWMIAQAYELARLRTQAFGFEWHVDHVIPLQGKLVSGLHVPHNLQVIPARANRNKSNKFATT